MPSMYGYRWPFWQTSTPAPSVSADRSRGQTSRSRSHGSIAAPTGIADAPSKSRKESFGKRAFTEAVAHFPAGCGAHPRGRDAVAHQAREGVDETGTVGVDDQPIDAVGDDFLGRAVDGDARPAG